MHVSDQMMALFSRNQHRFPAGSLVTPKDRLKSTDTRYPELELSPLSQYEVLEFRPINVLILKEWPEIAWNVSKFVNSAEWES